MTTKEYASNGWFVATVTPTTVSVLESDNPPTNRDVARDAVFSGEATTVAKRQAVFDCKRPSKSTCL